MGKKRPSSTFLRFLSICLFVVGGFPAYEILVSQMTLWEMIGGTTVWAADRASSEVLSPTVSPNKWTVLSDGRTYKVGRTPPLSAKVRIKASGGGTHRIKSVAAWLQIGNLDRRGRAFIGKAHGYAKKYPVGRRPKSIDSTVGLSVPQTNLDLAYWLVDQCNALAREKRKAGEGNRVIFGKDRVVRLVVYSRHEVSFTGMFKSPDIVYPVSNTSNLKLICKKGGRPQVPRAGRLQGKPKVEKVESVQLSIKPIASVGGACQVTLKFALKTNFPNVKVRYYLIDEKHHKSDTKTVTTNSVKLAGGTLTYDVPNGPGKEFGKIHMVGVSPNQFISNGVTYRMNCKDGPSGGLTSGQGSGGKAIKRDRALQNRIRQGRSSRGRQRITGRVRSRGIESPPPLMIPDPEPPALPNFELQGEKP